MGRADTAYHGRMPTPRIEEPDLPEFMTWEELEQLPEDIAQQIELWNGRVVWVRRGPAEHQMFTVRMRNAVENCARKFISENPQNCWRVNVETNVFLGADDKSDFLTPDFLVHRCLESPYEDVRATDTLLVGEVLSPGVLRVGRGEQSVDRGPDRVRLRRIGHRVSPQKCGSEPISASPNRGPGRYCGFRCGRSCPLSGNRCGAEGFEDPAQRGQGVGQGIGAGGGGEPEGGFVHGAGQQVGERE